MHQSLERWLYAVGLNRREGLILVSFAEQFNGLNQMEYLKNTKTRGIVEMLHDLKAKGYSAFARNNFG